jgi:hypothetical protein
MKKWILLIVGTLIVSGAAMADCGSCEAPAKDAKKKVTCDVKAGCKVDAATVKAGCPCKKAGCAVKAGCDKKAAGCAVAPKTNKK